MASSPALRALLEGIIDYAGLYPPANLTCEQTVENYRAYSTSPHSWMLRWLVIGSAELPKIPGELDGKLSVLAETMTPRAATMESKTIVSGPVYCEVPIADLDRVKAAGSFAKIRTGSIQPEGIPTAEAVASFILACADRRLPFKATAGLHHPVRSLQPLTYEPDPPRAMMHGFLNVFLAAAFAWHGDRDILPIVMETDPKAFRFDDQAHWRERSLTVGQLREVRTQFAHAFGSCSFTEPVEDLQKLGLL